MHASQIWLVSRFHASQVRDHAGQMAIWPALSAGLCISLKSPFFMWFTIYYLTPFKSASRDTGWPAQFISGRGHFGLLNSLGKSGVISWEMLRCSKKMAKPEKSFFSKK